MELLFSLGFLLLGFNLIKWLVQGYKSGASQSANVEPKRRSNLSIDKLPFENFKPLIIETQVTYEPLGSEERIIDNSKSDGIVKRKITISREWRRVLSFEHVDNTQIKGSLGISLIDLQLGMEKALQKKYGVSIEESKTFSEELELEVGPHSKVVLKILWKNIWQHAQIEYESDQEFKFVVPFKVAKGIIFDQIQEKVN